MGNLFASEEAVETSTNDNGLDFEDGIPGWCLLTSQYYKGQGDETWSATKCEEQMTLDVEQVMKHKSQYFVKLGADTSTEERNYKLTSDSEEANRRKQIFGDGTKRFEGDEHYEKGADSSGWVIDSYDNKSMTGKVVTGAYGEVNDDDPYWTRELISRLQSQNIIGDRPVDADERESIRKLSNLGRNLYQNSYKGNIANAHFGPRQTVFQFSGKA